MNADSNMAPDNAMWNPPIKLPYLIHFCGKVQLVVRFWPNEDSGVDPKKGGVFDCLKQYNFGVFSYDLKM